MSKKKAKIKSLGRLIVATYPAMMLKNIKTYKILKDIKNQADCDVPTIQRLLKKDKVINRNTQLNEFPMSWSVNYPSLHFIKR